MWWYVFQNILYFSIPVENVMLAISLNLKVMRNKMLTISEKKKDFFICKKY